MAPPRTVDFTEQLDKALATGDDTALRLPLLAASGLPGARMNLKVVAAFAAAVGLLVTQPDPPVDALEALLDGWAGLDEDEAPGDQPLAILPCAAVVAYGAVGVGRPDWIDDELAKLRRASADPRWRVREVVAQALQRLLAHDWPYVVWELADWVGDDDPLVVRAAVAAVAEPPLLKGDEQRATDAHGLQQVAVATYGRGEAPRRSDPSRTLRQALGFTISVTTAATGDFALLMELATSDDPDLRWIAAHNAKKSRLTAHPIALAALQAQLH
jgi:hypothetical protein